MNPQYAAQQPFGGFQSNCSPPTLSGPPSSVQGFQNVPLGPQKPPQQQSYAPPTSSPLNSTGHPVGMGPPTGGAPPSFQANSRPQIPLGQLPPSQQPPISQLPPSQLPPKGGDPRHPGAPQQVNSPPEQRPPSSGLSSQFGPLKMGGGGMPDLKAGVSNGPPPILNGSGFVQQPPPPGQPPKPPGASLPSGLSPNQFGQPMPGSNQPPRSALPPGPGQLSGLSQPPLPSPHPPHQAQSPNQQFSGQPPLSSNQPPVSQPPSTQPSMMTQSPLSNQSSLSSQFPSPNAGQPPLGNSAPPLNSQNQRPMPNQPPFSNQQQQPPFPGQPSLSGGPMQPPLPGQPQMSGQPPMPGQPSLLGQPPLPGQPPMPGPPMMPGQPPNQAFRPGQQPHPSQFNQGPPGPNNRMPPAQFNQPPLPGQPPLNPNQQQLTNQMQGMNLGGSRQYPGAPARNVMNGDNNTSPHMPPPLNQQYMNGQQLRSPSGPAYPPMPGQMPGQMPVGGPGGYPQAGYQQPQQPRKLDPDQMPSPIQVTQDDQQNRSGVFYTNQRGLVPPLVTTNFVVQDQGNSSPRFIRSTMYSVPVSQDIMKQTAVPFSLVISPMARTIDQEYAPPIVNFGDLGPVRCIRCKAYMCPFMQFIDSGRRFQCLFCKATTDVPSEYFQHLDHTGQRLDRYERPELVLGSYEFVATTDYCRNNTLPKPPAIIFVIDVSYNSVKSGLVHLLCAQMKEIIQNLPVDQGQEKSNMRVGFITYNSSVHFYNIKGNLAAPQMLVVGDVQEMFMPLLDGFLCTPEESGPVIDALMQQIPTMFGDTRETETILLPAILAGLEALKASDCTGKLLVFHSSLPTAEAPGKLKNRDDRKLLGTDKEKTVLTPQTQAYNQLGQDCVGAGCAVDLFIFNNAYIDVATISQVSRLTGGEVYKYTYFQADIDGDRLVKDIVTDISRPIAFDAIMRVRTSTGVRPTDFYGHFFMSNTTDMELAAIDCDKAVAVEIKHDDKLSEEEGVYVQAALLYTSCSGQRRLRILNLSLKTCSQMADLYRSCDCDTIINYLAKQATYKLYDNNPKAVKDNLVTKTAQILATYRKNCASPSSAGQLILPECMKLLPLYVNCLLKSDALSGGSDMTVDDRSFVMQEVMIMDIPTSVNYFYPRLIPLHDIDVTSDQIELPSPIRCTIDKMSEQGVYILENGIHMFLWIGLGANPEFIQKVFGVPSAIQVDIERLHLPELDNDLSLAVRTFIDEIRIQRHRCMRLTIVRQREKLEPIFKHFLAEDRGTDGSASYVDFLIHMHKEIRTLLS